MSSNDKFEEEMQFVKDKAVYVREKMEEYASKVNYKLYASKSIRDLAGYCGIASAHIVYELRNKHRMKLKTTLCMSSDEFHSFAIVNFGTKSHGSYIVDVTATQFEHWPSSNGYSKVEIIKVGETEEDHWKIGKKFPTINGFRIYQQREKWVEHTIVPFVFPMFGE